MDTVRIGDVQVLPEIYAILNDAGLNSVGSFLEFAGGTRICHKRGRSVFRLKIGARVFYLKRNRWNWVEFWKGLSRLRLPAREARREWGNICAVRAAGIHTVVPVAMGEKTFGGIEISSFLLTEELYGAEPLDVLVRRRFNGRPDVETRQEKRLLIRRLADLACLMHGSGLNHQDFYLNHFFLGEDGTLFLLDLQRVQKRSKVSRRYLIKDLGQLHYSACREGVFTRADRLRFLRAYLQIPKLDKRGKRLALQVMAKAGRIARHDIKLRARRRLRGELPSDDALPQESHK